MAVEILSRAEWTQVVKTRLGHEDFEVLNYALHPKNSSGGFLGDHFTADVTVRFRDHEISEKIFHFFVKTEPKLAANQELTKRFNVFKKEVSTLDVLFPKMQSVLKDGGKNMVWSCTCYYTRPDVIILEELAEQGFQNFTLRDSLGYKYFELTMKALANMHSASVIFEEKQSKQPFRFPDLYPDILEENFYVNDPNHPGRQLMETNVKTVLFLVELVRGQDFMLNVKNVLEKATYSIFDFYTPSKRFRNVVTQGDVKWDNILFRHENGEPVDVRIVDYQITRYVPPACDVVMFLFLSCNREFRQQHASQLLSVYYDQFSKNLSEHDLNPKECLSLEELRESCEFHKTLGISQAVYYGATTYLSPESIQHVFETSDINRFFMHDRTPEIMHSYKSDEFYKKNITDLIDEFIEICTEDN